MQQQFYFPEEVGVAQRVTQYSIVPMWEKVPREKSVRLTGIYRITATIQFDKGICACEGILIDDLDENDGTHYFEYGTPLEVDLPLRPYESIQLQVIDDSANIQSNGTLIISCTVQCDLVVNEPEEPKLEQPVLEKEEHGEMTSEIPMEVEMEVEQEQKHEEEHKHKHEQELEQKHEQELEQKYEQVHEQKHEEKQEQKHVQKHEEKQEEKQEQKHEQKQVQVKMKENEQHKDKEKDKHKEKEKVEMKDNKKMEKEKEMEQQVVQERPLSQHEFSFLLHFNEEFNLFTLSPQIKSDQSK